MAIEVNVVGFDIAKTVFQVHGVDGRGATVLRKWLRRAGQAQISSEPEGENLNFEAGYMLASLSQPLHQSSGRNGPGPYMLPLSEQVRV